MLEALSAGYGYPSAERGKVERFHKAGMIRPEYDGNAIDCGLIQIVYTGAEASPTYAMSQYLYADDRSPMQSITST